MSIKKTTKRLAQFLAVAALAGSVLTGCASSQNQVTEVDDASNPVVANVGYVNISSLPIASTSISPIRLQAIRETATTLGARGALAWRSLQIDNSLSSQVERLDHVFDFNQLLLKHNVLPPVLTEADDSINQDGATALRLASKTYNIISNAQFVTAPPTWRTYLWMNFDKPDLPDHTLLPNTQAEGKMWNYYLKQGWKEGLAQANAIFNVNLSRLKRDYMGMILYRKLYAEKMVSAPFVASTDLGVTGDANHIRINDRVLRITALSRLQTNSNEWNPVLIK